MTLASMEQPTDISQCEREPVHIPGAIQPHGVLLVVDARHLTVVGASDNAASLLGVTAESLLGQKVADLHPIRERHELACSLEGENLEVRNPFKVSLENGKRFDAIAHKSGDRLVLELEPELAERSKADIYGGVRGTLQRLQAASGLEQLCERTAREMRQLTGFDRVLVYAFKPDGVGEVVAEDCIDGAQRYLGLRFPASDIPSQARALYAACHLRMIPTARYDASAIIGLDAATPLDLTHAVLRSVSPVHREYMRNMGVTASMGISLMRNGQLWGLITCNHESDELFIPYETRAACGLIGEVVSTLIAQNEAIHAAGVRATFLDRQAALIQRVVQSRDVVRGLTENDAIAAVASSSGAAFNLHGRIHSVGKAPPAAEIFDLMRWLDSQGSATVALDSLPAHYPRAAAWKDVACGLLATSISFASSSLIRERIWFLWFRPEVAQTVLWGGDPNKPVASANERISPRKSFAQWKEAVHLKSMPFREADTAAAESLTSALTDVILEIEASRQLEANAQLLRKRERSLQLVLDSTGEGLVSVGLDGRLLEERSRAVELWFGAVQDDTCIWDVLLEDPDQRAMFGLLWRQLSAGIIPFEVAVDQLTGRIERKGRHFELGFRAVREDAKLNSILVTIEDVTARLEARREADEALETQAILGALLRDASGFGRTLAELLALAASARRSASIVAVRRDLHTLKGGAALAGLTTLASRCHQLEDQLAEDDAADAICPDIASVDEELERIITRVKQLGGQDALQRVEVPLDELTALIASAEREHSRDTVLASLRRWTLEPASRQLTRLAERARRLADQLGKKADVVVAASSARVDMERFEPLWSGLAHAISNAVDHGIEPEAQRLARGKAAAGRISLSAVEEGGWLTVEVADDGGGIDLEAVRAAASERGLPCETRSELFDALFADELSTRDEVTVTSGRGIGLAALSSTCRALSGTATIDSSEGVGTRLVVRIPAQLTSEQLRHGNGNAPAARWATSDGQRATGNGQ